MFKKSIDPDIFTYNSLINGFCMHDRLEEAKQLFEFMVSKDCLPNIVMYNTLINGFCKCERVEDGMELCREMSQKGLVGNTVTYTTDSKGSTGLNAAVAFAGAGVCGSGQLRL
ncbi:Pentatricopeptide repeat-containing protein [Cardamine amara subsp. amara]|uniref:Pentatricopeptide repeat-containing protein n=1 Tax=Cardamine amara subsp. amara TaxID=228776 RepID=A0ABD1BNG9_CARAN